MLWICLFSSILCNRFWKWMLCIVLKWEELSCCIPTVSNSIDGSGKGWLVSIPLTWLFSESVQVLSGRAGLRELREHNRIESVKLQDLDSATWGGRVLTWAPLFPRRASLLVLALGWKISWGSNQNGDPRDHIRQCFPNFHSHNSHWVFVKSFWAPPPGILIH